MAKTFRTSGAGSQQTLHEIEDEKIPVYDTTADAEADLANLAEEQIVATKDAGGDEQTLIEYVDGRLETTEVNVSVSISGLTCKARKSGNTVTVVFIPAGSDVTIPYASTATIGTLPEGYRPVRVEEFTIGARVVSSTENVAVYPPRVTFGTDGNISVRAWNPSADIVLNSPYNTFTFLVDGTNSHGMTVNTLKDAKDYTDARAVRKYDYTMTGTTSIQGDIQTLCNHLRTLGDGTYSGEFFRAGQTSGHYSISIKTSSVNVFLNGIVQLGQDGTTSSTWSVVALNDAYNIRDNVINRNMVVATPASNPGSYRNQILYALINTDWSFLTYRSLQSATGRIELSGYWWMQYTATHIGGGYIEITGTVDCESRPVTFSAYYDASQAIWYLTISNNFSSVLISTPGTNVAQQLTSLLNYLAPQTWGVYHDEGIMELQGYFYANYTMDCRGGMYFIRGTTYSSNANANHQPFTAEFNTTNNTWDIHNVTITASSTATTDGNGNFYIGDLIGGANAMREIIWVHSTNSNQDYKMDPMFNYYDQWWVHVSAFDTGAAITNTSIPIAVKYRIL